ncbi:MAG TPA: amidohydrolase family protein [Candidatus Acidoferrales bacterium]|nr:amidohydrolase family protein [Candidatus Acidoferrales bacterium]
MHIDAHQHFWRYERREYGWIDDSMAALRRDFLPADLKPELERSGFQGCVAVQARQTLEETRWLLELAEHAPFILGVVGWVDLRSPRLTFELESFARHSKLVGVRHIVQSEPDDRFLLQPDFLRGIATLEEFDLAYDILIYPRHLPVATEFVARFPRQRFVLDHLAKPPIKSRVVDSWAREIQELASFPNLFCKVSGLVTEADWQAWKPEDLRPYLDVAFECFGPSRLMIGSDWPVCTLAAPYSQAMDVVKNYIGKYAAEERNAVLGGNAAKFWKLKPLEKRARD